MIRPRTKAEFAAVEFLESWYAECPWSEGVGDDPYAAYWHAVGVIGVRVGGVRNGGVLGSNFMQPAYTLKEDQTYYCAEREAAGKSHAPCVGLDGLTLWSVGPMSSVQERYWFREGIEPMDQCSAPWRGDACTCETCGEESGSAGSSDWSSCFQSGF